MTTQEMKNMSSEDKQKLITNITENLTKHKKGSKEYENQIKVLRILSKNSTEDTIEVDLTL